MDNAAMQALIDEYGNALCYLIVDNHVKVPLDYKGSKSSAKLSELELVTYGGVDFIKIRRRHSKDNEEYVFYNLIVTETVQNIIVMDDGYIDMRVDPLILA